MKLINTLWNYGWEERLILALLIFAAMLIPVTAYSVWIENARWRAFLEAHACKLVGKMSGGAQTGFGVGVTANGQVGTVITTINTPSKTGWLCDDGVTYWR